jgi:D-alanyl-D-alanine carboxypeptidase (penicillin-binding protein 5/6)
MPSHRLNTIVNRLVTIVIVLAILSGILLIPYRSAPAATVGQSPDISAAAAVLIDFTTGEMLFSKNVAEKKAPASITKILTAHVALEMGHLDDRITVGANPPRVEGTRVYLVEGETLTLRDLLYGMLLNSGNDAALAIAEYYGGSEAGFATLMNEKARELGAHNSNFVNPSGLSDPEHYTTAHDMAIIARAAMHDKTFREIVATRTRPWSGKEWETTLTNQNKLLWNYDGANGIKNGYTSEAHFTLVASATRQNQTFIAVILDEPSNQQAETDAALLLDYGFKEFKSYLLVKQGEVVATIDLKNDNKVDLIAANDLAIITAANGSGRPTAHLHILPYKEPVQANTSVGAMVFRLDGNEVGRVQVINLQPIPPQPLSVGDWWLRISLLLAALFLLTRIVRKKGRRRHFPRRTWNFSIGRGLDERY